MNLFCSLPLSLVVQCAYDHSRPGAWANLSKTSRNSTVLTVYHPRPGPPPSSPCHYQVGLEEQIKGFTQSEDIVVSIFVPYCEAGSEWEVVVDAESPNRCPDLVPVPSNEADAGKVSEGVKK